MNDKFGILKIAIGVILFFGIIALLGFSFYAFQVTFCVFSLVYKSWIVSLFVAILIFVLTRKYFTDLFHHFVFSIGLLASLGVIIPCCAVLMNKVFASKEIVTRSFNLLKVDEVMDYDEMIHVQVGPPKPTIKLFNISVEYDGVVHTFQVLPEHKNVFKGNVVHLPISNGLFNHKIINWNG